MKQKFEQKDKCTKLLLLIQMTETQNSKLCQKELGERIEPEDDEQDCEDMRQKPDRHFCWRII